MKGWKSWDFSDDTKLLLGTARHGFGNWKAIKQDPELGLERKIFEDNNKETVPKIIHISRRAEYLLGAMREAYGKKKKIPKQTKEAGDDSNINKPSENEVNEPKATNQDVEMNDIESEVEEESDIKKPKEKGRPRKNSARDLALREMRKKGRKPKKEKDESKKALSSETETDSDMESGKNSDDTDDEGRSQIFHTLMKDVSVSEREEKKKKKKKKKKRKKKKEKKKRPFLFHDSSTMITRSGSFCYIRTKLMIVMVLIRN